MNASQKVGNQNYYLGLDIGTDSVGWAVTDPHYNLKKYKNNLMWGISLFDQANPAADRRSYRTARRRLDRRQQRIAMLQELIASEVLKVDEKFFLRLKESALYPEDSENRSFNIYFDDENYTDENYFSDYPTIHHLICELMKSNEPHDVRLVYLACAYLLAHRGHFLSEVDKDNVDEVIRIDESYGKFMRWFDSENVDRPFECDTAEFSKILKNKSTITAKEKEFVNHLFAGKIPESDAEYPVNIKVLIKMLSGGKIKISDLFKKEYYSDIDNNSVSILDPSFSDTLDMLYATLDDGDADLLLAVKMMHDWSLLNDILQGEKTISQAKVNIYNEHKADLKDLKHICRNYLAKEKYNEIFRTVDNKSNYVYYSHNIKSLSEAQKKKIGSKFEKCSQENFCKYIKACLKDIHAEQKDAEIFERISKKLENNTLCPKQVNSDNRVIPYQLYYAELKTILDKASGYLAFLNETDEYGSVKDKILQIMLYKIPYYVGPLVSRNANDNCWAERKQGKIYPWNFDEMVDKDKSENEFIRRMTCKCTYLAGENVMPKYSLLYYKFNVLNEINNIKVNGQKISVQRKQEIYSLFEKNVKLTKKKIKDYLISVGEMSKADELSGIDDNVKSSLKSYHNFKNLLKNGVLAENDVENIIEHITVNTDKARLKKWLKDNFAHLSNSDLTYVSNLKYTDYGRLSRKFLTEIYNIAPSGEVDETNIITKLWKTNENLMQILSEKYGYKDYLQNCNDEYYCKHPTTIQDKLKEMYIPNAVMRSVQRTLDICKELKTLLPCEPAKIFVEMARGEPDGKSSKGKPTDSRKTKIEAYLKVAREFASSDEINHLESKLNNLSDSDLRSKQYYLYFQQLGRCMYSGEPIDFEKLGSDTYYNIDHIFPQAKVKDDSFDNMALVLSTKNADKGDDYPIKPEIRTKMYGFWKALRDKEIISEKKYTRLIRNYGFTESELIGFINRQLVETRQSTLAVAKILNDVFPNSEVVYVKAGIVSDFRHEYDMLKCREINDFHHAKDAYLNIVMGNVHDVKFTRSPINFIQCGEQYSMKLKTLLKKPIERYGVFAWNPDESFDVVKHTMSKNSIRFVRYAYKRKGGFFNQNPERAVEGLVPRKAELPTEKYGGYNSTTASCFVAAKYAEKGIMIIPVEVMYKNKFIKNNEFARKYAANMLSQITGKEIDIPSVSFPLGKRLVKANTMFEIDGARANLVQKSNKGKTLVFTSATSLIVDKETHDYVKVLSSFLQKSEHGRKFEVGSYDGITAERNAELFDLICLKCTESILKTFFYKMGTKIKVGREIFTSLSLTEQAIGLMNMISLLKTGRSQGCDLTCVGESKQAGVITLNSDFSKLKNLKSIYIIDQSPTGLIEHKTANLLEL